MKKSSSIMLKQGTLWESLVKTTESALKSGALLPIPTEDEFIREGKVNYLVRVLSKSFERKEAAKKEQQKSEAKGRKANPFLPYEEELFVADISDTHVALLNKFNVMDHHLLIVTRRFEDQKNLLTVEDFEALCVALSEYESLGFYNGGVEAGASQPHKHLQLVPLPLASGGPSVPIEPIFPELNVHNEIAMIQDFIFPHAFVQLNFEPENSVHSRAEKIFNIYGKMLKSTWLKVPVRDSSVEQSAPYCFLMTTKWMLLVPRSREFFEGISFNSLAFVGALLVRNREHLEVLKKAGATEALKYVALS